ncbi:MAG: hypothetical protein PVJ67_00045 [Candidatus Pacearchaeota archaeon]|jgi:hypothetical protein
MTDYKLIKEQGYQMQPNTFGIPHEKIYVGSQFLPSTNQEWETFFSVLGMNDYWVLNRTKVPKTSIIGLEGNLILLNEKPITTTVHEFDPKRKPLVEEWLGNVKPILEKMGYGNSESFRDYFER